jgi:uncharacterized protein involved in outer membrane biogenesis
MMKNMESKAATQRAAGMGTRQSSVFSLKSLALGLLAVTLASCDHDSAQKSHGPITLGDSATIVTETDPALLQDRVVDLNPVLKTDEPADTVATAAPKDTATVAASPDKPAQQPTTPSAPPQGKGLNAAFSEVTVFIPNIETRTYGKQDLSRARGATYELTGGNLAGNQLRTGAGTVTKVMQRYQTAFAVQNGREQVALESLGAYTSGWETLKGSNGSYTITGLDPNKLEYKDLSANSIRNAVQQTARRERMSRKETQQLLDATRNVRSADGGKVKLRSVSWRIEGKDARGRSFSKELRIDVPLS